MSRNYTRAQQRRYKDKQREFARKCADRLLGKKKVEVDHNFFSGTQMLTPIQYSCNVHNKSPRLSSIITGMEGI